MRYLKQLFIIILFSFLGEFLHYVIPLQIPASIYGLVSLFVALMTGIIKPEQVRETAKLLVAVMPVMFIPAGVGLMESWGDLKPILLPVFIIMVVSTVLVMGISARVTQTVMRLGKQEGEAGNE